ncbi:hypothetical protein PYCC9005_003885 [Savitreella phatthalungensis]
MDPAFEAYLQGDNAQLDALGPLSDFEVFGDGAEMAGLMGDPHQQQHQQQAQHDHKNSLATKHAVLADNAIHPNGSSYPTPVNSAPFIPDQQQQNNFMSPFAIGPHTAHQQHVVMDGRRDNGANMGQQSTPHLPLDASLAELDEILFTPMLSPAMTPMGSTLMRPGINTDGEWDMNQQLFSLPGATMDANQQQLQQQQLYRQQQLAQMTPRQMPYTANIQQRQKNIAPPPISIPQHIAPTSQPSSAGPVQGRFAMPVNDHVAKKQKTAASSRNSSRQGSPATPAVSASANRRNVASRRLEWTSTSKETSPVPSEAISPASIGEVNGISLDSSNAQAPITPAMLMHLQQQQQQTQQRPDTAASSTHSPATSLHDARPIKSRGGRPVASDTKADTDSSAGSPAAVMRSPVVPLPPPSNAPLRPRVSTTSGGSKTPSLKSSHSKAKSVTSSPALGPTIVSANVNGSSGGGNGSNARIRASPELRPLLPGGMSPQLGAMLASKSNYQHIVDGTYDQLNISYPTGMTHGLETRRTSHKAAEQKRRDHLKECFEQLRSALADKPDIGASKIVLLKKGYEQLMDQQMHLRAKDDEIAQLRALIKQSGIELPPELDSMNSSRSSSNNNSSHNVNNRSTPGTEVDRLAVPSANTALSSSGASSRSDGDGDGDGDDDQDLELLPESMSMSLEEDASTKMTTTADGHDAGHADDAKMIEAFGQPSSGTGTPTPDTRR